MLNQFYNFAKNNPSDINEHIETLHKYSLECNKIVEMGVRTAVSTWGFIKGLADNPNNDKPKQLIGVDLNECPVRSYVTKVCSENNIHYQLILTDSAKVDFGEYTDLLFIDTWHVYGHLKRELENHCHKVKKYIIMHDTEVDKIHGESLRCGCDINKQVLESGYPEEEIRKGLQPALDEFLEKHPEFVIHEHFQNNNGLTILRRRLDL